MLEVHCEDPRPDRRRLAARPRGRRHATALPRVSRPPYVEAEATGRAIAFAAAADAPLYVVHLSSRRRRSTQVARSAARRRPVFGRDLPALPGARRRPLRRARPRRRSAYVISPPLRAGRRPGRAVGRAGGRDARPGRHRPRPRSARRREARAGAAVHRDQQRRAGHRDAARDRLRRRRRRGPDHGRAHGRPALDDAGAPVRARPRRARSRWAATPTSCCSTPRARRTLRAADLHHTSDYTPYEGLRGRGRGALDVFVRGRVGRPRRRLRRAAAGSGGSSSGRWTRCARTVRCRSRSTGPGSGSTSMGRRSSRTAPAMRDRPTVVLVHGGPGTYDHSYFKPHVRRRCCAPRSSTWTCATTGGRPGQTRRRGRSRLCADDSRRSATRWASTARSCSAIRWAASWRRSTAPDTRAVRADSSSPGRWRGSTSAASSRASVASAVTRPPSWRARLRRRPRHRRRVGARLRRHSARTFRTRTARAADREPGSPAARHGAAAQVDIVDQLGRIDCPTLVCVGELDPITPVAASREIIEGSRRASGASR